VEKQLKKVLNSINLALKPKGYNLLLRYIAYIVLFNLILVMVSIFVINLIIFDFLKTDAYEGADSWLSSVISQFDSKIAELYLIISTISYSTDTKKVILNDPGVPYEEYLGFKNIFSLMSSFTAPNPHIDIFVISSDRNRLYSTYPLLSSVFLSSSKIPEMVWYQELTTSSSYNKLITDFSIPEHIEEPQIAAVTQLNYLSAKPDGFVIASLRNRFFREIVESSSPMERSFLIVADTDGNELFRYGAEGIVEKGKTVLFENVSDATRFTFRYYLDTEEIGDAFSTYGLFLIIISIVVFIFLVAVNSLLINSIISEVKKLARFTELALTNKRITMNDLSKRHDIIGSLSSMVRTIIDRNIRNELLVKDARIELLQKQIHPHFLYNTLESLSSKALQEDQLEISDGIAALGRFLRYSQIHDVDHSHLVTLGEEIRNCRDYLALFQMRYQDRITASFLIPPGVESINVVKFMIQPVLENSIIHGAENLKIPIHTVISAVIDEDNLILEVRDNGKGMEPADLTVLQERLRSGKQMPDHIGLLNVQERILLCFGHEYGIEVFSEEGRYFIVRLKIPLIQNPVPEGE
jgi:sensor histidine kinase YesM